jgi:carbamoyltransferase
MYILGIHDGHNCGASLILNGKVLFSLCEERISRNKNEIGYPKLSIDRIIAMSSISVTDLSAVVFASNFMHSKEHLLDVTPWYKVGKEDQEKDFGESSEYKEIIFNERRKERVKTACEHLNVSTNIVHFVEHHLAHLAAAYYTRPEDLFQGDVLGLTSDGAGDGLSATVSICKGNSIERISSSDRHSSLGKLYSRTTMLMGMKPWEHEYKLMGMAPYADPERSENATNIFRKILAVNEETLEFKRSTDLSMNYTYEYLKESFEGIRFDVISASIQKFTEEMLLAWIRFSIKKTGIKKIVCGGGVFMNVKANMLIANLPEVEAIYIMPSGGDESLSIGAALEYYNKHTDNYTCGLENLYLGGFAPDIDNEEELVNELDSSKIHISKPDDMELEIAKLLSNGEIVARCRGEMEWGARSLGNRSILCKASNYDSVDKINSMIKVRDFWMPFAPSILDSCSERYFSDIKKIRPYYMTFGFKAKDDTFSEMIAASHPRDRTIRPQLVTKGMNANYHRMLTNYEKITGSGVVLNTSFNLHGEPIVYSISDAIRVFLKSGLSNLALNDYLLSKK